MEMSGSGGFYKYRCKNFYSHNCPNWVWVNNSPCATCIVSHPEKRAVQTACVYMRREDAQSDMTRSANVKKKKRLKAKMPENNRCAR